MKKQKNTGGSAAFRIAGPMPHMYPVRNLRAAYHKGCKESYPDGLGLTVWTAVKGARPQVILFSQLRMIIEQLDKLKTPYDSNIRIKITDSTAGLSEIRIGKGPSLVTLHHVAK